MKRTLLFTLIAGAAPFGFAADFTDTAQVISATPIIERITEARRDCPNDYAPPPPAPVTQERGMAAPVLGGVTGAVIGRQVGSGNGRDVATAVGAVAGTVAGDRMGNGGGDRSYTGSILGGVAGAILGNQVGGGRGNAAATAAGAIAGAMVGDRVDNRATAAPAPVARLPEQPCRTVETSREVVKGYTVVYRYNDRDITTTLPYNPGSTVRVGVGVITNTPVAAQAMPADYLPPPSPSAMRRPRGSGGWPQ